MIRIEFLFPEVANLYGEPFNVKYLQNSLKEVEVIETSLTDIPKFTQEKIDMLYMGSMSEKSQEIVIEKLKEYKNKLKEFIDNNKVILLTGNALEVFGQYIEDESGNKIKGLGIFDTFAKRNMKSRFNTLFLGEFEGKEKIKIVGFKSTFSFSYGENDNEKNNLFKSIRGCGLNKQSILEGIRINNCFGTYIIGPLLILNPHFTKYIMTLLGEENPKLKFEEEITDCYNKRLKVFEKKETNYLQ